MTMKGNLTQILLSHVARDKPGDQKLKLFSEQEVCGLEDKRCVQLPNIW